MKEKFKDSMKSKFLGQYTGTGNKEKSMAILLIGFAVIFVLIITYKINNNKPNNSTSDTNIVENNEVVDFLSLDKIFVNYIDNYKYEIIINDNGKETTYKGSIDEKINTGVKSQNNTDIKYNIVDGVAIDLKTNKEISNLYDEYLSIFFTPSNILDYINDKENSEEVVDNKKIYTYNNVYNDSNIMFKITTTKDRIEEIKYSYNNIEYSIKLT